MEQQITRTSGRACGRGHDHCLFSFLGRDYAISKRYCLPNPRPDSYGHLAVDLFFAISGFVICLVVSRDTFNVQSFFIKRVFRLYPLWLVMLTIFAITAWRWRGLQPRENLEFFLYSATLLPTQELPFYNVGWSLQHEMVFYLIAAVLVPFFGLIGLAVFLIASTLAYHSLEMPWYLSSLASHHATFLAGVLAFLMRAPMAKLRFFIPAIAGVTMFCARHRGWAFRLAACRAVLHHGSFCKSSSKRNHVVAETYDGVGRRLLFPLSHSSHGVLHHVGDRQQNSVSALVAGTNPLCLYCHYYLRITYKLALF